MREYGRGIIGAEVSRDNREMPKSTDEKIRDELYDPVNETNELAVITD